MNKNTKINKNTKFTRTTVAPNIEQLGPKNYRARVSVNGERYDLRTTNLKTAKTWVKQVRATGNPNILV